ncbi:MAG: hypothetical protein P8Y40_02675 [Desulfobacterales bacterium]
MTCTLSGRFISFDARVSHSDELGGELTSLIKQENTRTHTLVRDVLVDLPGRDTVQDFLALDENTYRVYETDSADTEVSDQSGASTLALTSPVGSRLRYSFRDHQPGGLAAALLSDHTGDRRVHVRQVAGP